MKGRIEGRLQLKGCRREGKREGIHGCFIFVFSLFVVSKIKYQARLAWKLPFRKDWP